MKKILAEDTMEQLYWVDEKDRVLGKAERKRAHDEGLIHRENALLVYDRKRRVLFQKRSMKKRSNPGMWSTSVAGHIGFGFEAKEEMLREAEEEIGLRGFDLVEWGKEFIEENKEKYFKYWFAAEVPASYLFELNAEEVDEVEFFSEKEMNKAIKGGQPFNPVFVRRARRFWQGKVKKGLL